MVVFVAPSGMFSITPSATSLIKSALSELFVINVCIASSEPVSKITFVAMATADAVKKGAHAGKIVKEVAAFAGGGGGGKPDAAQAGGKDISKVDGALALVETLI